MVGIQKIRSVYLITISGAFFIYALKSEHSVFSLQRSFESRNLILIRGGASNEFDDRKEYFSNRRQPYRGVAGPRTDSPLSEEVWLDDEPARFNRYTNINRRKETAPNFEK